MTLQQLYDWIMFECGKTLHILEMREGNFACAAHVFMEPGAEYYYQLLVCTSNMSVEFLGTDCDCPICQQVKEIPDMLVKHRKEAIERIDALMKKVENAYQVQACLEYHKKKGNMRKAKEASSRTEDKTSDYFRHN